MLKHFNQKKILSRQQAEENLNNLAASVSDYRVVASYLKSNLSERTTKLHFETMLREIERILLPLEKESDTAILFQDSVDALKKFLPEVASSSSARNLLYTFSHAELPQPSAEEEFGDMDSLLLDSTQKKKKYKKGRGIF
ncbi:MAG: hypothetical protein BGO43_05180 [Gammaproteobacteria bacterium 39-13]|nr:hypothetical protein [Gammaproteobacteria bacterium]OJV96241.1 MAG: hypothetical protein BGO43_05180 [Gammaproteobacteria bacterium 39-13]